MPLTRSTLGSVVSIMPLSRNTRAWLGGLSAIAALLFTVAAPASAAAQSSLGPNQTLGSTQSLWSPDGHYRLIMQDDGHLVLYHYDPYFVAWKNDKQGNPGAVLTTQGDGNLVEYAAGHVAVWDSKTAGRGTSTLVVQDDGNAVTYGPQGATWSTRTGVIPPPAPARAEQAISWFMARQGSTAYEGRCERAVEEAFGTSGRYATARANWTNRPDKHNDYATAPRGALVFYDTSASGHVAISLGNGQVVSTSARGHIGTVPISYFQRPLGWASSPW